MPIDPDPFIELEHVDEAPVYIPSTISVGPLPSCEVDPATQIIEAGKYVKVADECRRERWLKNVSNSLLTSNNGQTSFDDGSEDNPIMLGNLRSAPGLGSIVGLHNNKLSKLVPSGASNQVLAYSGGSLSFQTLLQSTLYPQSSVGDLSGAGWITFLVENGGNYEIKKWRTTGAGTQPYVLTQNPAAHGSPYEFSWSKFQDLDHDASSMVMYYWDKTTEMVVKLEPPTLGAGESYSDYRLTMNDATGAPEWTNVATQVQPAMGRWQIAAGSVSGVSSSVLSLTKSYDGGGGSPRFTGTGIKVTVAGQVSVCAEAFMTASTTGAANGAGLVWYYQPSGGSAIELSDSFGRGHIYPTQDAANSVSHWALQMAVGDELTLRIKSLGPNVTTSIGNVVAHHFPLVV